MIFSSYDAWKLATPPDTDPAPVECTNCGRLEACDCGQEPDEWDEGNALPEEGR